MIHPRSLVQCVKKQSFVGADFVRGHALYAEPVADNFYVGFELFQYTGEKFVDGLMREVDEQDVGLAVVGIEKVGPHNPDFVRHTRKANP